MDRGHVLIADDQSTARDKAARVLRDAGYRVALATDGQEALDRFRAEPPDLVVLDVLMPRVGGLDVVRALRSNGASGFVPIILISARADAESKVGGLRAGADDFLAKPYEGAELLARVEAMLRIKRMHEELCRSVRELEASSVLDPLTAVYNHRFLARRLPEEFARAQRYDEPLALLLVDVDGTESLAERSGQAAVDRVLRGVAEALGRVVRTVDLVARSGSDEFVLLLPSTHLAGALPVTQRIYDQLRPLGASACVGAAFFPSKQVTSADELLGAAGLALARARQEGPGWVCLQQHQSYLYRPERQG
jgi:diguanylate cyclase (GGDEF)-like protein